MGLTEDRILAKCRKLDKEIAEIYDRYAPQEPKNGCMEAFDKLDDEFHKRMAVRPLSAVEIDMAIIDYKKKFTKTCVEWAS